MRTAIAVIALIAVSACHRPKLGPSSLVASAKSLGKKAVAIAGVDTKINVKVAVNTDTLVALAKDQAAQRVAGMAPITLNKSVRKTSTTTDAAPPATTTPEPTITRTTVDTGSDQVWKNLWRDGERASCEKVASFDSCSATCSEHMRGESMKQLAANAGKPEQCECTQGYSKCQ
jgi:hypothetical protein